MLDNSVQQKALKMFVDNLRNEMRKTLQSKKRGIWTGAMLDSLDATLEDTDDGYLLSYNFGDNTYFDYVDKGVSGALKKRYKTPYSFNPNGKKPPLESIKPWADSKGLNPWAVRYNIWANGTRRLDFIEPNFDKEFNHFLDYLAEAEALQILNGGLDGIEDL